MTESVRPQTTERPLYVPFGDASPDVYRRLGFRCGLEIHQQLSTNRKLFCRCPAGQYQSGDAFDAQLVRHMRPTLSELGEYDGTALMEFKTRKNITYRIMGDTACTYDIDDTPPFALNREALRIAIEIALLLKASIVGELHITRKQYLDGSIPTGFQRTGIVAIEGEIPLPGHTVRIIQLSVEEDSCREVSDIGHERVYTTDRLGMPLVETVTYPDLRTPEEAAKAAHYLRYLTRSTGKVRTGIGAARQDVNVSIEGGTRAEIKGVQHIRWIPRLTHNETFRQNALLAIRDDLTECVPDPDAWHSRRLDLPEDLGHELRATFGLPEAHGLEAVALPHFRGVLPRFTSPGRCFADEISDRLKVIACIEKPNMDFSESQASALPVQSWRRLVDVANGTEDDAVMLVWGPPMDIPTALETIDERCRWAFVGVPNETRKAMPDGTTVFERVLPGPDRMYPDTDSAPIPIDESLIEDAGADLPETSIRERMDRLEAWDVPADAQAFVLRRNLFGLLQSVVEGTSIPPRSAGTLLGHVLRSSVRGKPIDADRVKRLVTEAETHGLCHDILEVLLPLGLRDPGASFPTLLDRAGYRRHTAEQILERISGLRDSCRRDGLPPTACRNWIMGQLRPMALGNVPLRELATRVEEALR